MAARIVKGPFEIYFNEFTEKYHLVQYTGELRNGARTSKVLGRYDDIDEAKFSLVGMIEEVLNSEQR